MAISSIGVGSGLPLDQLLTDIRNSENNALVLIQQKQITVQSRLSAYGTLKSQLDALKTAAEALGKDDAFGALKTSVNGEAFTATASSKGVAGQYQVEVSQLATAQTLRTQAQAERDTPLAGGSVTISITLADDTTKTLTLDAADTSLNGIMAAINKNTDLGISATMVNSPEGDTKGSYLLFTAKKTGETASVKEITVTDPAAAEGDPAPALQDIIGFKAGAPSALTETAAENAKVKINGIEIISQSNTVENAIEGVTLNLTKKTTEAATLTITKDDAVTSKAVTTFVNAYNTLLKSIKSLTSYDVEAQKASALTGDGLARNIQSQMRDALNVAMPTGTIRVLSQMGITTNPTTGELKIDDKKLAEALKDHMPDVRDMFAGTDGISKRFVDAANAFTKSDGLISAATDGVNATIKDLQKQYDATSARIDAKMETLRLQFAKLDGMVAQMNSISTYLTQQLSMLGNSGDKK